MGWLSPTDFEDPSSEWSDEPLAYDEDTATRAQHTPTGTECVIYGWLVLKRAAAFPCDKIRLRTYSEYVNDFDVYVLKDGVWVQVFFGLIPPNVWYEISFAQGMVSAMRIRAHSLGDIFSPDLFSVWEADFWEVEAAPVGYQYSDGLVTIQC